jgi:hypothetical protein
MPRILGFVKAAKRLVMQGEMSESMTIQSQPRRETATEVFRMREWRL